MTVKLNRYEIALWIAAVALIALGTGGVYWFISDSMAGSYSTSECDENGVCAAPVGFILRQLAYAVGPSASTGGFLCVALALALRAHESYVRDRGNAVAADGFRDMTAPHVDGAAAAPARAPEATALPAPVYSGSRTSLDEHQVILPRTPVTPRRQRSAQSERDYSLFMPPNDGD
ncbi:MAG TPA: hypothetical protein VGP24_05205 [Glaciihabitans sp.]|nr:hypothetical protein [Glaciihabitans sp.]